MVRETINTQIDADGGLGQYARPYYFSVETPPDNATRTDGVLLGQGGGRAHWFELQGAARLASAILKAVKEQQQKQRPVGFIITTIETGKSETFAGGAQLSMIGDLIRIFDMNGETIANFNVDEVVVGFAKAEVQAEAEA